MSQIDQWRKEATAGSPRAQLELAYALLTQAPARETLQEAQHWVIAACKQNIPEAFMFLAVLSVLGLGRKRNIEEAYQLLARAAALGNPRAKAQLAILGGPEGFKSAAWSAAPQLEQHASAPRVYTIKNLIPKQACTWLIDNVRDRMARAPINTTFGAQMNSSARTNTASSYLSLEQDLVVQMTNLRIFHATAVPMARYEVTNILRYEPGQEYTPHFDFLVGQQLEYYAEELKQQGQRVATLLIYLNEGYEGGETDFPRLNWRFKGETGDALLFWNASESGEFEKNSLHAGLPVTRGEKWLLSKWIRERPTPLS